MLCSIHTSKLIIYCHVRIPGIRRIELKRASSSNSNLHQPDSQTTWLPEYDGTEWERWLDSFGQHCPMHVVHTETKGLFSRIFDALSCEQVHTIQVLYKYCTSTAVQDEADPLYVLVHTIQYKNFYNSSVQYKTVHGFRSQYARAKECLYP